MESKRLEQLYCENVAANQHSAVSLTMNKDIVDALITVLYDSIGNKKYIDIAGKLAKAIQVLENRT